MSSEVTVPAADPSTDPATDPARSHSATPASGRPGTRRAWLAGAPVTALLVLLLALLAGGGAPEPVPLGLPDPGVVTAWGLPLFRLVFDLCAVAVIGALVTAVLVPRDEQAHGPARRALRVAGWGAWAWATSAVVLVVLTVSDVLGVPPDALAGTGRFTEFAWQLPQSRSLLVVAAVGVVLAAYTGWARTRAGAVMLLAVAIAGLLPVLFVGHSFAAVDYDLVTSSLVVHVVAASMWVGGLFGVLLLVRGEPRMLATTVARYSTLAMVCFVAVAGSGSLNVWLQAGGDWGSWIASGYGALLLAKIAALAVLGGFGWWHRRRTIGAVAAGRPGAFARLATGEVLVMSATVGLAVALSRTPPPAGGGGGPAPSHGPGHPTLGAEVEPFGLARLVTEWRPEAIWLALVGIGLGCYLAARRRLRANGERWPWQRTGAAVVAATTVVVATSGGLAAYSTAVFSAQVGQFLVLFVVVPTLVCLSAPVTLSQRSGQAQWWAVALRSRAGSWLVDPLNTLLVSAVLLFGLYATPLLEMSLRSAPLHLAVNLLTLAVGTLFWWSVLGIDVAARTRPNGYHLGVLVAFLFLLGAVGARIYLSDLLLAGAWFSELDWFWLDLAQDQRLGAGLMWAVVAVFGPLLVALTRARPSASGPGRQP